MAWQEEDDFVSFDDQWLEALGDEERVNILIRRRFYNLFKDMSWKRDISVAFFCIALLSVAFIIVWTVWNLVSIRFTFTLVQLSLGALVRFKVALDTNRDRSFLFMQEWKRKRLPKGRKTKSQKKETKNTAREKDAPVVSLPKVGGSLRVLTRPFSS